MRVLLLSTFLVVMFSACGGNQSGPKGEQPSPSPQAYTSPTPTSESKTLCEAIGGFTGGVQPGGGWFSSCASARAEASGNAVAQCEGGTLCSIACSPRTCKPILASNPRFATVSSWIGCRVNLTYRCACSCQ